MDQLHIYEYNYTWFKYIIPANTIENKSQKWHSYEFRGEYYFIVEFEMNLSCKTNKLTSPVHAYTKAHLVKVCDISIADVTILWYQSGLVITPQYKIDGRQFTLGISW